MVRDPPPQLPIIEAGARTALRGGLESGGGLLQTAAPHPRPPPARMSATGSSRTTIETPAALDRRAQVLHPRPARPPGRVPGQSPRCGRVLSVPYEPVQVDPAGFSPRRPRSASAASSMRAAVPIYQIALLTGSDRARHLVNRAARPRPPADRGLPGRTLDLVDALIAAGVGPIFATSGEGL